MLRCWQTCGIAIDGPAAAAAAAAAAVPRWIGGARAATTGGRGEGQAVAASARCKAVADPVSPLRYTNFVLLLYAP